MDAGKTGALIAAVRREKEMTQKDVAERLHVSVQAVSKWEQGKNFPDITLLEPLGELLGLTVAELAAGCRHTSAQEESLRSLLKLCAGQLKRQTGKWKRLSTLLAALLGLILLFAGGFALHGYTELFPQKETVLTPLEVSAESGWWADSMIEGSLLLYDVRLADDFTGYCVQLERWTENGVEETWELSRVGGGAPGSWGRRQKLAVQLTPLRGEESGRIDACVRFVLGTSFRPVEGLAELTHGRGLGMRAAEDPITVDRETGALLCWYIVAPEDAGRWSGPAWHGETPEPAVGAGETYYMVRLLCDHE